jgi:beta-lactamase class A
VLAAGLTVSLTALTAVTGCANGDRVEAATAPTVPTPAVGAASAASAVPAAPASLGFDLGEAVRAAVPASVGAFIRGSHRSGAVGVVGVSVRDQVTGVTISINDQLETQTASIVKVDILATRLLQHQQQGTRMSAGEKRLAYVMITQSDNNAATALFAADGRAGGLARANKKFGMVQTVPNSRWGVTHTRPADQLRLLQAITDPAGPLTDANRAYLLDLMTKVEAGQRWGVPAAAGPQTTAVYVKNGWETFSQWGGMWGINTIGRLEEPGHDWLIVALTRNNASETRAQAFVGKLCALAVAGLRMQTAVTG